jgi:hypothetical protein
MELAIDKKDVPSVIAINIEPKFAMFSSSV